MSCLNVAQSIEGRPVSLERFGDYSVPFTICAFQRRTRTIHKEIKQVTDTETNLYQDSTGVYVQLENYA